MDFDSDLNFTSRFFFLVSPVCSAQCSFIHAWNSGDFLCILSLSAEKAKSYSELSVTKFIWLDAKRLWARQIANIGTLNTHLFLAYLSSGFRARSRELLTFSNLSCWLPLRVCKKSLNATLGHPASHFCWAKNAKAQELHFSLLQK